MASIRFAELQSRPTEFLDFTSLTLDEFHQLVPSFEAAFQAHMATWRLDGKPRTARQLALVPFDVRPSRAIWLDDSTVSSHAPPQRHILVMRRRR